MAKRIVKTYKDTSAKGDRTPIEGNRYFLRVELVSIKAEEKADKTNRTSEYYIKCGGKGVFNVSKRTPDFGTIDLELNETFTPRDGITLFSGFYEEKGGGTIELPLKVFDQDFGKDQKLIDTMISIKLGQGMDYQAFQEGGVKLKIGVSANRTRY